MLLERVRRDLMREAEDAQLVGAQAGHDLVGRHAGERPVEVADRQRALHRRGVADELLGIQLVADAQLAPEAPDRVLQREQRGGIAVRAPHQREEVDRRRAEVRREVELERRRAAERARAVAGQPHHVRRAGDVGVELAVGDEGPAGPVTSPSSTSTAWPAHSGPAEYSCSAPNVPSPLFNNTPTLPDAGRAIAMSLPLRPSRSPMATDPGGPGSGMSLRSRVTPRGRGNSAQRRPEEHRQRPAAHAPGNVDRRHYLNAQPRPERVRAARCGVLGPASGATARGGAKGQASEGRTQRIRGRPNVNGAGTSTACRMVRATLRDSGAGPAPSGVQAHGRNRSDQEANRLHRRAQAGVGPRSTREPAGRHGT